MTMGVTGGRLVILAAVCVLLGALQLGAAVLVPVVYAVMIAAVLVAPTRWLTARGVPSAIAVALVMLSALASGVVMVSFVGASLRSFLVDLPQYRTEIDARWAEFVGVLDRQGIDASDALNGSLLDPGAVLASVGAMLSGLASMASDMLMVLLLATFLLLEAEPMVNKLRLAFAHDGHVLNAALTTGGSLQTYLYLKTLTSAATGATVGICLIALGVAHPALWAFLAFLLNYIPTIGSIFAAVPPVLLAVVTGGPVEAAAVTAMYFAVNTVIGNVIEPRVMGDQLGLSAFVVLLALFVWGWLWGINGMLLSVPLTVLLRELCATQADTRWIATLMGPGAPTPSPPRDETSRS